MSSSFAYHRDRSRDQQDGYEVHVWGEKEYPEVGSIIKVRGTDTKDEEAEVVNLGGVDFKLKKDANTEVILLATSSDTMMKMAIQTIPKDKQRRWREEHSGIQYALDPEFALDFAKELAHITKHFFAVGKDGEFEVKKKEAYFRVDKMIVDGELIVNKQIKTPKIVEGSEKPPGFKGNEQEEKKSSTGTASAGGGGGGGGGTGAAASSVAPTQLSFNFSPQMEFNFG